MAIVLRATKGSALTIAELDGNFTDLDGRVTTLEGEVGLDGVGIADITQDGSQLTITMTDATEYTFTFAGNGFAWRGEWVAATGYVVDDVITVSGSGVYLVLKSHTSAATFDPDELVSGSPAYALMISDTGGVGGGGASGGGLSGSGAIDTVPIGGTTGQVLTKDSNTDFDYSWQSSGGGGSSFTGAVLSKASSQTAMLGNELLFDTASTNSDASHYTATSPKRLTLAPGYMYEVGFVFALANTDNGATYDCFAARHSGGFVDDGVMPYQSHYNHDQTSCYISGSSMLSVDAQMDIEWFVNSITGNCDLASNDSRVWARQIGTL